MSSVLLDNIKQAESCRLAAYLDTENVWTIGWGHTPAVAGQTCTQEQADAWLAADVAAAAREAASLPEARGIDPRRLDALTELLFNLGGRRWALFIKTREAIADRDWQTARKELLNSRWAGQVGKARSKRIADVLLTGM